MRTIKLKLYKPGKRKRQIIDEAMENYSRAYQYLLDKAQDQIKYIEEEYKDQRGRFRASNIAKWAGKDIMKELNIFGIEPFKDSLKKDFSTTIAGYLNLKASGGKAGYPFVYLPDTAFEEEYDNLTTQLISGVKSLSGYEKEIKRYIKKNSNLKPLFFCRYDVNRDYSILYDPEKDRYYVKIYLLNAKSDRREYIGSSSRKLKYIHKSGMALQNSGRKERFILFPLSFGKYQEKYLKEAREKPEVIKTARLTKEGKDYFLSVNIDNGEPEQIRTDTYMGISRGISAVVFYTVAGNTGNIINNGIADINKNAKILYNSDIHRIANKLVEIAGEHNSAVIMQRLVDKGDRLQWEEGGRKCIPVLDCRSYNRLYEVLKYKLPAKGLPPPLRVSSAGIFHTCPNCRSNSIKNRFSGKMFMCTKCGWTGDIEYLGSFNLARRLVKYQSDDIIVKAENTPYGIMFTNEDLGLEFYPENPYDCMSEFNEKIKALIDDFYRNINVQVRDKAFKKKYSLIKKIQSGNDFLSRIKIIQ